MASQNAEHGSGDGGNKNAKTKRGRFLEEFKEVDEISKIIHNIGHFFCDQIATERNLERFQCE